MHDKSNEKKLVEAFKTFFDKSIGPYVSNNESIMNEWKYFNKLISSQPIDYSQIQFYILLANKSQVNYSGSHSGASDYRSSGISEQSKYNQNIPSQKSIIESSSSDKKSTLKNGVNATKKRNLINSLESFQNLLIKNQEKLELFNRRDIPNQTAGSNTLKRYH